MQPGLRVTLSMGLSDSTALGDIRRILAEADTRLYQAKRAGRNRIMPAAA